MIGMSTLFYVSYGALWLLLLVMAGLLLLLYRHFGVMAMGTLEGVQRDGLAIGAVAPLISAVTAEGEDLAWEPKRGRAELLLFAATDCEPCADVLPHVNRLTLSPGGKGVGVTAVVAGPREEAVGLVERHHPAFPCLADDGSGAFDRYLVRVTPFGFVIGPDGRILAKGLCSNAARLRNLLAAGGLDEAAAAVAVPLRVVRSAVGGNGANGIGEMGEGVR